MQESNAGTQSAAQAQLAATQATQPGYNALNLQQLQTMALPEAQVGQQVQNSNALAGSATNLADIQGAGGAAATAGQNLNELLNPNYYKTIGAASTGATDAINAINLGGLSPGEEAATERSLNQNNVGTGNLGNLNPTNTISNAMNFGGAFNNKIGLMNNATNAASNVTSTAAGNAGYSPTAMATGQPSTSTMSNFGTSAFGTGNASTNAASASNAFGAGNSLLGTMGSTNNALIGANEGYQASNNTANSPAAYMNAGGSMLSACCFIFLEAYQGKIPWYVRHGRDRYYRLDHNIATGYRRCAYYLVPLMRYSKCFRVLVWHLMVKPITSHLGAVTGHSKPRARGITHAWLKVWAWLGKGKKESDYMYKWDLEKGLSV